MYEMRPGNRRFLPIPSAVVLGERACRARLRLNAEKSKAMVFSSPEVVKPKSDSQKHYCFLI